MRNKKGAMTLSDLGPAAIAFVFIAVILAVGANITQSIQDGEITGAAGCNSTTTSSCSSGAFNATAQGLDAINELGTWLPTIALVLAAAVVIGVLLYFRS